MMNEANQCQIFLCFQALIHVVQMGHNFQIFIQSKKVIHLTMVLSERIYFPLVFLSLSGKIYVAWSWSPHEVSICACHWMLQFIQTADLQILAEWFPAATK